MRIKLPTGHFSHLRKNESKSKAKHRFRLRTKRSTAIAKDGARAAAI
jgi:hypothetical protein